MIPTSVSTVTQGSEGELASQAPLQPRSVPPLTRSRARLLNQVVLSEGMFGTTNSPPPMLTLLQTQDQALDNSTELLTMIGDGHIVEPQQSMLSCPKGPRKLSFELNEDQPKEGTTSAHIS